MLKQLRYVLLTGLILVGGLFALPVNSVLAAENDMTITINTSIPLSIDTSDIGNPVLRGTGDIYMTTKDAYSRQFVQVSIPDEFTIVAPDGEYTEDEGIKVNYFGSMNARKGYKNYEAVNSLNGRSENDLSMGSIEVVIPITKELLSHGKGKYSVSIPITFKASEAYGSYNSNLDFTPWEELIANGDVDITASEIRKVSKDDEILDIDPSITGIMSRAFSETTYKEVYIPPSLTSMNRAFEKCNVETIVFGEGTTKVSDYSCYNAKSIRKVVLPSTITELGTKSFGYCENLSDISIPDEVTLGAGCFESCKSIKEFTFKEGMKLAYPGAEKYSPFYDAGLESLIIEEGVTNLPSYLCCGCKNLSYVYLPTTLSEINTCCVSSAPNLKEITIRSNLKRHAKSDVTSSFKNLGLERIVFEDGITTVPRYMFCDGCSNVTKLILPDSITTIESNAFSGCTALESLNLPDCLTSIEGYAFMNCSSLTSLDMPDSLTSVGIGAFKGARSLSELHINSTWKKASSADVPSFEDSGIMDIYVRDGVNILGNMYLTNSLDNEMILHLPTSVTKIETNAFKKGEIYSVIYEGTMAEYESIIKPEEFNPVSVTCSDTPDITDTLDITDTPDITDTLDITDTPDITEISDITEIPDTPDTLDITDTSDVPDTSFISVDSDISEDMILDFVEEIPSTEEVIMTDNDSTNNVEILEVEVINNG